MGKKYLDTKGGTLESSILDVWKQAAIVKETNKNDKSDDGEGLDAVQPKAVKKKFKDRKDKDIDNDGDTDSSDKYLHKRRKAVSKAVASEARQLKDKKKEMMVKHKRTGVKVIDKSDWPVYKKKGYFPAEEVEVKEGTWAIPKTVNDKNKLKDLLKKPIKLGKDGDDASKLMYSIIGDDELLDDLYVAGKKNPNGDARPLIKIAMKRLGIKEEVDLDEKLISARGKDIAQKMNKSRTMKPFAKKVAKMQTVTPDNLEKMLPDYVAGKDIYSMFEEVELDEGGMKRLATGGKAALKGFKKKPKDKKNKKEEVEEEVADQYTEASYFTVQSMRDRLHQVWGEAKEEFPDHKDDEKKIKGKKSKTDTGKDAAVVDVKPEIKERKK